MYVRICQDRIRISFIPCVATISRVIIAKVVSQLDHNQRHQPDSSLLSMYRVTMLSGHDILKLHLAR